jgi:hypothetical protein
MLDVGPVIWQVLELLLDELELLVEDKTTDVSGRVFGKVVGTCALEGVLGIVEGDFDVFVTLDHGA